jgi:hypothetical protein
MANDKEVDWTKEISNESICTYYYYIFIVTAVVSGLLLVSNLWTITRSPKMALPVLMTVPTLVLAVVNTLFIYIVCSRALLK